MNFRVTIGLLLVLATLLAALAYSNQTQQQPDSTQADTEQEEVFAFSAAEVQRLEVEVGGQAQTFARNDGGAWAVEPGSRPANERVIETALLQLTASPALRRIPSAEANLAAYGLENPRLTVQLHTQDGAQHSLGIGAQSPVQTGYYAHTDEGGDVYLLPAIVPDLLERLVREPLAPTPTPVRSGSPTSAGPTPAPQS